jgi:hypothetical protein
MVTEEFIRQIARDISHRIISEESVGKSPSRAADTLLIFDDGADDSLRSAAKAAYPEAAAISQISGADQQLASCSKVVLVAPSLDLASKITLLQTDCPAADLIIRALLAGKRVVAVTEGMLACRTGENLPPAGIYRAVEDLRAKLADLGIEMIPAAEMGRTRETLSMPAPAARSIHLPILNSQSTSQHPSRERVHVTDALNEFVDFLQTKQCTMEKNKPCDHCDICNTLGF